MEQPAWIECSLTVEDGELSEAVAEVLGRYIQDGIMIQAMGIKHSPDSHGEAIGPYKVCGYIPSNNQFEATRLKIEKALWYLGRIQPLPKTVFTEIKETNWVDLWKQHYTPIPIGKKLMILPVWEENPQPGSIPILIDPGMAFGTGTHPTTQLTMQLMEDQFDRTMPETVLDIGSGSGILSITAAKLGAHKIFGVDIDETALENGQHNIDINKVEDRVTISVGSVLDVRNGAFGIKQADLVLANILVHILIKLLDLGMGELIAPGGRMILSGILEERLPDIHASLKQHNLVILESKQLGDWVALLVKTADQ